MKILLSAGHGGTDNGSTGADRGTEKARTMELVNLIAGYLRGAGHTVTAIQEKNASAKWNLKNRSGYDYALSVHFNAYNGTGTGTEVLYKGTAKKATQMAEKVSNAMGIKNRGAKSRPELYMLNIGFDNLVEICFHDNSSDLAKYNANKDKVAKTIAEVITDQTVTNSHASSSTGTSSKPTTTGDITYKTYDNSKKCYLPSVTNDKGYAGNKGYAIGGIKAMCKNGNLYIQAHVIGKLNWEQTVTLNASNFNSSAGNAYAGILGKNIDMVKIWSDYGYVDYRVSPLNGNYYGWVSSKNRNSGGPNSYAGVKGKSIDRIQMK